ncbi:hypothetical protein [Rhizobium phage RHph_X2_24]|nr:hypothetical protein [Rhizobium phage RHph_X2_24]
MIFNRATPAPTTITEEFVQRMTAERNRHADECTRLRLIIEDATERLTNHRAAADALNEMLLPFQIVPQLLLEG